MSASPVSVGLQVAGADVGAGNPVPVAAAIGGNPGAAGDGAIATGGTAQTLFGGATPANGFAVYNPDPTNDLWISLSGTAAANAQGSIRIAANGGGYETPPWFKPFGAVSIIGAVTGQKFTAIRA
ncbi:MAG: hypothetical protein JO273_03940 [Methylobacteriaceae bacterium]|nr:hypothetical protein [Methylobacteriaceae bacterium]